MQIPFTLPARDCVQLFYWPAKRVVSSYPQQRINKPGSSFIPAMHATLGQARRSCPRIFPKIALFFQIHFRLGRPPPTAAKKMTLRHSMVSISITQFHCQPRPCLPPAGRRDTHASQTVVLACLVVLPPMLTRALPASLVAAYEQLASTCATKQIPDQSKHLFARYVRSSVPFETFI